MDIFSRALAIAVPVLEVLAILFVFGLGCLIISVGVMYLVDRHQSTHTIRRNYPVIGRFRYLFEHIGEFFRQYFFAMDREELPFNRAERAWVYRAAKNVDRTIAFGSSKNQNQKGSYIFLNSAFPFDSSRHSVDEKSDRFPVFGFGYVDFPYQPASRYNISAMSFGALSKPAVRALSHGAARAGVWMNTGEGGLSPYHLETGCDLVVQIGTAKYGVRDDDGGLSAEKLQDIASYEQVKMFEIKLSQGAKPGKGGILPGAKVTAEIASIRGIPEGQDSLSPCAHPEFKTVGDMLDMVAFVREQTHKPVGFKLVLGASRFLDDLFMEIVKRGKASAPDFITVDSSDGGTGAAPQTLMDQVGLPLANSLPTLVRKLQEYGLRDRVRVIASGKLINPGNVAAALCLGADYAVSARGFMFALGCIQALQCNSNTCPTGITTHNRKLQHGLDWHDKAKRVESYINNMHKELVVLANSCGVAHEGLLSKEHLCIVDPLDIVDAEDLFPAQSEKTDLIKVVEASSVGVAEGGLEELPGKAG
ncbi:Glutamate synthase [NADPH] large chain [BD1-7 clade bacterium]|uniref:Glutamate synthase [NADPH] large chain n=1 Tax=BD1-7 clade bacterium TaxID=2029982 RepID=A0A5S9PVA8_9GAMM|nr:Glutamate synthase [NADPH] large chain [BD1-7 clade bacterium]